MSVGHSYCRFLHVPHPSRDCLLAFKVDCQLRFWQINIAIAFGDTGIEISNAPIHTT